MNEQQEKDFAKALEEGLMVRIVGDKIIMAKPLSDEDYERARAGTLIERVSSFMAQGELEQDILDYIGAWWGIPPMSEEYRLPGRPTFGLFEQRYGKPGYGGLDLSLTGHDDVLLWSGLSQQLASAIINLIGRGEVHWHWALPVYYLEESRPLPLPLASWPVTERHTTGKTWLPVEFLLGPSCDGLLCPSQSL